MKPRSVLLVTDSLHVGGGEHHVVGVAMALHRRGYAVRVACSRGGPLSAGLASSGIEVRELGSRLVRRRTSPLFAWRLRQLVRDLQPQVVHTHMYASGAAGMLATWGTTVLHVHTEHSEALWRGPCARAISRRMYRDTARIIAVSLPIRRRLIEQDGVAPDRVAVIACSVMPSPFRVETPGSLESGRQIIGVVARLQPEKGMEDFLAASSVVARALPTCTFIVVGDGPLRGSLTAHARALGLQDRVQFLGYCSNARALIAAMDVLVVPSRSEGAPLVILEAMTAGVPVVATSVGGIPDQMRNGVEGLLVPAAAPQALAEAIVSVLRDPVVARRYGEAGRRRIAKQFDYDRMIHDIEAAYGDATSQSPFPGSSSR